MKLPTDFVKYYTDLKIPKPPLEQFLKMDLRFTMGIYLDYFTTKGLTVDVSTIGCLIRKYPVTDREANIIKEVIFDQEYDIIIAFSKGIQEVISHIENPF